MTDLLQAVHEMEELEGYRLRALRAWDKFDSLHDKWFAQLGDRTLPDVVSESDVDSAEAMAIQMQRAYFQLYYELNSDQCTCKPDSAIACDVCQAQINAKSTYREEM